MKSISKPNKKIYTGIAISIIVTGAVLLVLSFSNVLNPIAHCQDNLQQNIGPHFGSADGGGGCNSSIDPMFELVSPSSSNFILIVLSACLAAFGAAIFGMILRL